MKVVGIKIVYNIRVMVMIGLVILFMVILVVLCGESF